MAPSAVDFDIAPAQHTLVTFPSKLASTRETTRAATATFPKPLVYSGGLHHHRSFEVTPIIGREYPDTQLVDLLGDDTKLRDLAIQVSQRGVVFFRNQSINVDEQKILAQKLGELTGKPETSKLHKHALSNSKRGIAVDEHGKLDDEISVISSEQNRKYSRRFTSHEKRISSEGWHSDVTFEAVPSDYAILKIHTLPEDGSGGDTIWASGYEAYDRLSPVIQKVAEGLTATHFQPNFINMSREHNLELINEERGSPENTGLDFRAVHPVIRTNPVTGWKSIFGAGGHLAAGYINDVTDRESELLKSYFLELISNNHDLQVRFKWNKNDVAIWDNRSTFHTATNDYDGVRQGNRVASIGEKPYLDPNSVSRREALEQLARDYTSPQLF